MDKTERCHVMRRREVATILAALREAGVQTRVQSLILSQIRSLNQSWCTDSDDGQRDIDLLVQCT